VLFQCIPHHSAADKEIEFEDDEEEEEEEEEVMDTEKVRTIPCL
jgi:hypothetical protein